MAMTEQDQKELLVKIIQEGMKNTVTNIVNQYVEEAKKKLEAAVPEIISTLCLQIWKSASLERFGHNLQITVSLDGRNNLEGGDKDEQF